MMGDRPRLVLKIPSGDAGFAPDVPSPGPRALIRGGPRGAHRQEPRGKGRSPLPQAMSPDASGLLRRGKQNERDVEKKPGPATSRGESAPLRGRPGDGPSSDDSARLARRRVRPALADRPDRPGPSGALRPHLPSPRSFRPPARRSLRSPRRPSPTRGSPSRQSPSIKVPTP